MITITQYRDKDGERYQQPTHEFESLEAMAYMAKVELGWGARVIDISENRIQLETRVMNCVDTSIFEGTTEELQPLFGLIYYYTTAAEVHQEAITAQAVETASEMNASTPFLLSMLAPILIGDNRLKVAVMLAAGLTQKDDIEAGLNAEIDDLVAAVQLQAEGTASFREALA